MCVGGATFKSFEGALTYPFPAFAMVVIRVQPFKEPLSMGTHPNTLSSQRWYSKDVHLSMGAVPDLVLMPLECTFPACSSPRSEDGLEALVDIVVHLHGVAFVSSERVGSIQTQA